MKNKKLLKLVVSLMSLVGLVGCEEIEQPEPIELNLTMANFEDYYTLMIYKSPTFTVVGNRAGFADPVQDPSRPRTWWYKMNNVPIAIITNYAISQYEIIEQPTMTLLVKNSYEYSLNLDDELAYDKFNVTFGELQRTDYTIKTMYSPANISEMPTAISTGTPLGIGEVSGTIKFTPNNNY